MVGEEGEQLGIVPLAEAMAKAEAAELDLVEIAPTAKPPVCRIMDYGKFKYREAKKQHEAKLKLKQIQVKEVKFRPGTDEGDYKIKLRNLTRFPGRRRQGEDHAAVPRPRDGAPGIRDAPSRADPQRSGTIERGRIMAATRRPADGDAAGAEEGAAEGSAKEHHPTKPEAGSQVSPPESTAVGSK